MTVNQDKAPIDKSHIEIAEIIEAFKSQIHIDGELHDVGALDAERKKMYQDIKDDNYFEVIRTVNSKAKPILASEMVVDFIKTFVSKGGKITNFNVRPRGMNAVGLILEILDNDDHSAYLAYTGRNEVNRKYMQVGLELEVIVVEQGDGLEVNSQNPLEHVANSKRPS